MEYTVKALANLAGITPRTIRHYDEIGLLKPFRVNSSGYRIYGQREVDLLQQILFFRELDLDLDRIKEIISNPDFDEQKALKEHHAALLKKQRHLGMLIETVEKTIQHREGVRIMSDKEKFEAFKKNLINENEEKYGEEIRERYGEQMVESSNEKLMHMSEKDFEELETLSQDLIKAFLQGFRENNPSGQSAQKGAELHKKWLCFYWKEYTKEAHRGVVQMYVDDERFKEYYDKHQEGLAGFIRDAVFIYTDEK